MRKALPHRARLLLATGVVFFFVCLFEVSGQPNCAPPPAGLLSWWRAESDASDFVGTNSGTLAGNAAFGSGEVGQAFVCDGNNGTGVQVGNAAGLRLQAFTIEAWIARGSLSQVTAIPGNEALIFGYGSGGYGLGLDAAGRPLLTRVDIVTVKGTTAITDAGFHHLAVTKTGTTVIFYIDGVADPAPVYSTTFAFSTPAALGARGDSLGNSFWGTIDELAIYDHPLAPSEILALYNAGTAGKCSGPTAPSITGPPVDQIASAGSNVTFSVLAAGSPVLFYQWEFSGTNLPGATNYILNLTNVQAASVGSYLVVITNVYGSTSAAVTLALQTPPTILNQPQTVSASPGSVADFAVGVTGSTPFHFQWFRDGTNPVGANNYSLHLNNVQIADAGNYTVVVSNNYGSVTSAPAALLLNAPPIIFTEPGSQSLPAGANASFAVTASSPGPLNYQWRFGGTNLSNATNSTLALNNVGAKDAGAYSVVISNAYGATTSSNAFLTVTNPSCAIIPAGLLAWWQGEGSGIEVLSGNVGTLIGNTTFTVGKAGQAFSFDGSSDAVLITNSAALQLQDFTIEAWIRRTSSSIATFDVAQEGIVFGFGAGGYGFGLDSLGRPLLTQVNVQTTKASPAVTDTNLHHVGVTKSGTNVIFYVDGVPYPAPSFGPTFSFSTPAAIGARGDNFRNSFLGAVDEVSIYNRPLSAAEIQSLYYATSQGKCAFPLSWVTQPTNQIQTIDSNATFTASVNGSKPIAYQWSLNGAPINSATNSTLNMFNLTFFQAGSYALTASNGAGAITSSNATLTLLLAPLLANGSFESGISAGWVLTDLPSPFSSIAVHGAGYNPGFGFFSSAPTDGSFCLTHGFDGDGPGRIRAAVDVYLPPSPITLSFNFRAAWDMQNYPGSTKPRVIAVTVEPYGGGVGLQTNTFLTALPGTANYDTGNQTGSVDLSAFSGRGVRISFDAIIPESFTGPGFFQLDNVVISYFAIPPFLIANSGGNVVLSWPIAFTNFTTLVATNISPPITWTSLGTNLIVRSATNASLTQPITPGNKFYRLKSF